MGTGVLFLSGSNTYTGPTAVNGGTLQISGAGVLGGGSYAGNIAIASGAALLMNTSSNQTLSGTITGFAALTQAGPGTLALTGNNNYAGATTISAGTLQTWRRGRPWRRQLCGLHLHRQQRRDGREHQQQSNALPAASSTTAPSW